MAKENPKETRTSIDDLNDSLTGIGQKIQNNSKVLMWSSIIVVALVAIVLIYVYAIRQPGIAASNDAIGQADMQALMGNDSIALAQYQTVANDYGYAAGNRANLNAAILLYKEGKYQEALDYVKKFDGKDKVIAAAAKSLEGDCLVNLEKYQEAANCFAQAAKTAGDNPAYTPLFLMKEATVYRALKDYKKEAALYKEIIDQYPAYGPSINLDIEKYLKRAELAAGQE
ncbi:MAG: tetratricopeptide repeat protein [Muribaculaceae bacterium]|nr:tetratricopeptide repeat protein [Muribaculaceae bacterium]